VVEEEEWIMSAFSGYLVFLFASFAATFSGAAERQVGGS